MKYFLIKLLRHFQPLIESQIYIICIICESKLSQN